ncbi:Uncharacterised protein [Mycobacteroides abscessus subsp. massiliense]|nr:Uncharacterised protein [Mycobacteroides abscessus subsp. massiliense]
MRRLADARFREGVFIGFSVGCERNAVYLHEISREHMRRQCFGKPFAKLRAFQLAAGFIVRAQFRQPAFADCENDRLLNAVYA